MKEAVRRGVVPRVISLHALPAALATLCLPFSTLQSVTLKEIKENK